MSAPFECSSMRDDEVAVCGRLLAASFEHGATHELTQSPESDVFVVREAGGVRGLVVVRDRRVGFGGAFVRAAFLSSLCVDERERGRGFATALVEHVLRASFARGVGAAILIPRTESLYARIGFAHGGARYLCELDLPLEPGPHTEERVRPFERGDEAAWLELAECAARERTGGVVPTVSDRARRARAPRLAYVVERAGSVVGSLTLSQRLEDGRMTLYVHELFALDRAASAAAWAHIASFSAQVRLVRWRGAPADPLADFAHAAGARFSTRGSWMLRLVDARRFLTERGFAHGSDCEHVFAVEDPLLPENAPPFTLAVAAGRGRVHEGGRHPLTLDCATAASLFSGSSSASRLCAAGRLRATATELERLDATFALPPAMLQSLP